VLINELTHTYGKVFTLSTFSFLASSTKILLYSAWPSWSRYTHNLRRHCQGPPRCGNIVLKVSGIMFLIEKFRWLTDINIEMISSIIQNRGKGLWIQSPLLKYLGLHVKKCVVLLRNLTTKSCYIPGTHTHTFVSAQFVIATAFRLPLGPTQPPAQWIPGLFPWK